MSKYSLFLCDNCDFTYEHVDRIFYLNDDLSEIEEDTLRIITSRQKTASKISGFVFVWYCINCKDFVFEYDITDNSTDKTIAEIEDLIKRISKHDKLIFSSSVENNYRNCPICAKKIDSVWNYDKCPACDNGKLHLLDKYIFD